MKLSKMAMEGFIVCRFSVGREESKECERVQMEAQNIFEEGCLKHFISEEWLKEAEKSFTNQRGKRYLFWPLSLTE